MLREPLTCAHSPGASPSSRCLATAAAILVSDVACGPSGAGDAPAQRHRRRAGRRAARPAERRRSCATRSSRRTSAGRRCSCSSSTPAARSTSTSSRCCGTSARHECRSWCGSDRRAPRRRAPPRSSPSRRRSSSVSPGSSIGPADPLRLDDPGATNRRAVTDRLAALAVQRDRDRGGRAAAGGREPPGGRRPPRRRDQHRRAHGRRAHRVARRRGGHRPRPGRSTLSTATVVGQGLGRRRQPNQEVRFRSLDLASQLLHTLISPSIAYFLFVAGLALIVFEFFTAGSASPASPAPPRSSARCVGFSHLPVAWWAVGLLMLGRVRLRGRRAGGRSRGVDVHRGGVARRRLAHAVRRSSRLDPRGGCSPSSSSARRSSCSGR